MLANVSHEFRTPLNAVIGQAVAALQMLATRGGRLARTGEPLLSLAVGLKRARTILADHLADPTTGPLWLEEAVSTRLPATHGIERLPERLVAIPC